MTKETRGRLLRMLREKAATLRDKIAEAGRGDAVRLLEEYIRQERAAAVLAAADLEIVERDIVDLEREARSE